MNQEALPEPLMARITLNPTINGLSGKMDGWVYRQQNGRTSVMPHHPQKPGRPTAAQRKGRERFRAAHAYASEVLSDPLRRELYQNIGAARNQPPNALLISIFLTPPTIERIERNGYDGRAGHALKAIVTDAIEVVDVSFQLRTTAGAVLESGPAVKDHGIWLYHTTSQLPAGAECQIEITARNRARAEGKAIVAAR
jgi:hypothetical protein